jgi:hypothetical protein
VSAGRAGRKSRRVLARGAVCVGLVTASLCAAQGAQAAGGVVIVPPSVVQSTWRMPDQLTKDARPRTDPMRAQAVDTAEALAAFRTEATPTTEVRWRMELARLAGMVAPRVGVERAHLLNAWHTTTPQHQVALVTGLTTLGVGYEFGSDNPKKGLDCSGLIAYAWKQVGVELPLQSLSQYRAAKPVEKKDALAGDLIWYPGHTMMYLGVGDAVLHSARPNAGVRVGLVGWRELPQMKFGNPLK